jgi:hypothetical protein
MIDEVKGFGDDVLGIDDNCWDNRVHVKRTC